MLANSTNHPGYDFTHHSKILQRQKSVRIITGTNDTSSIEKIVYLLHPFATNRFFWADYFINFLDPRHIFVLPESGRNWFINDSRGMHYEDYFISELIPEIESQFPSIKKRMIGGFSMGGATAFFLSLRYPRLFDLAFSFAGAFDAYKRDDDPYHSQRQSEDLMIPTTDEHEKVWGKVGSITRDIYNLPMLHKQLSERLKTQFIFEVGLQDHNRIIQMNREAQVFFGKYAINYSYYETSGNHSKKYAYKGLSRIIRMI